MDTLANSSKSYFNPVSFSVLIILLGISAGLYFFGMAPLPVFIPLVLLSFLIAAAIHIADQWEKAVVLRMGKYKGLKGPGLFLIIPVLDRIDKYIDQRVRVTDFKAEQTLTQGYRAGQCGCRGLLDRLGCGKSSPGSAGI